MIARWTDRAWRLRRLVRALLIAYRDPRTPVAAKIVAAIVVGCALSPVDPIPDVVPLLGYLDDLVLIPLGVALAIRLIPRGVWVDALDAAAGASPDTSAFGRIAAVLIVALWVVAAVATVLFLHRWL